MSGKPENPRAFPFEYECIDYFGNKSREVVPGMSLRDYFAGQAVGHMIGPPDKVAREAYEYADAMLKAREATQ